MLTEGTVPLPDDDSCHGSAQYWYERTPYRRVAHLSCDDGERPDRGRRHLWVFILFAFTMLVSTWTTWYYR
jgi:hypothetical protein